MLKKNRFLLLLSIFSIAVLLGTAGNAQALNILYGGGDHNMITGQGGSWPATGLAGLGHSVTSFNSYDNAAWATALSGGYGAFDAIVVGQRESLYYSLNSSTKADIADYVSGGGRFILAGAGNDAAFINSTFGYSVSYTGLTYSESTIINQNAANAAGTTFADDASTLRGLSATYYLSTASTPGTIMYEQASYGTAVFIDEYGSGLFAYYGWDFCCLGTLEQRNDWYNALESGLEYNPVPEPATMLLLGSGLLGLAGLRRKSQK